MATLGSLAYASGNSASTTLSASVTNTDTAFPLTSDTNFALKSGTGMVIIDEGTASEEIAYATTKSGASLTIPLANRGLEGTSAAAHDSGATVKGILTAGMWNDLIDGFEKVGISYIIDGGGVEIADGVAGDLEIPFACTITGVTMLADQSGSIVVDIWKDTYANYPPTDADTITSATPPTITSATKSQDTTLTGWTKTIAAGSTLRFNVDSCTTITRVTVSLTATRT